MAPSNLQGLNIVQPEQPPNPYLSDADLLSQLPPFADFNAQLDLWTDLSFQTDEPIVHKDDKGGSDGSKLSPDDSDRYDEEEGDTSLAPRDAGFNHGQRGDTSQALDLGQLLAGFGLENFPATAGQSNNSSNSATAPSLAQLLALYANQTPTFPAQPHAGQFAVPEPPVSSQSQRPDAEPPVPKRARTRKASVSSSVISDATNDMDTNPLNATEDKRRRNTAASARFRLKKKEREQALEKKSKELEGRVTELERECEGLRRENGWLKGLVVGVTGAQQKQQHKSQTSAAGTTVSTGSKRLREDGGQIN